MQSLIFGASLFALSTYLGWKRLVFYKKRVLILQDIRDFTKFALSRVAVYKDSVGEIVANYSPKSKELLSALEKKPFILNTFLTNEEREVYNNIFFSMDKLDIKALTESLKQTSEHLSDILESAQKSCKKEGELYFKLGILIGLAVFIIVI